MLTFIDRAATGVADMARVAGFAASTALAGGKRPVSVLTDAGQQLNDIVHDTVDELIAEGGKQTVRRLDAGARHLKRTIQADDLRSAMRQQLKSMPAARRRVRDDFLTAMGIYRHTGIELRELATETWGELTTQAKPARKKPTRKKAAVAKKKTTAAAKKRPATRKKSPTARKKAASRKKTTRSA